MSGKFFSLLLALCLAQSFAVPNKQESVNPANLIDDALNKLKELAEKAKQIWENLTNIIKTNAAELIEKVKNAIENLCENVEQLIEKAGACGAAELPKLKQLKDDALNAANTCIISEIPDLIKLAAEIAEALPGVVALVEDITAKVTACNGNIICLGKVAAEEIPKITKEIEILTPIVKDAIEIIEKMDDCATPHIEKLKVQIEEIIDDLQKCLG